MIRSLRFIAIVGCLLALNYQPLLSEEKSAIFKLEFEDLDGDELVMSELLEKGPVLFEFFATWCKPCQLSMPEMQKLSDEYGSRGLTVIGISVDGPRNYSKIRPFVSRLGTDFPIVWDEEGEYQRGFKVTALPTAILYGQNGEVLKSRQGYRPGESKLYIETLEDVLPAASADSLGTATADSLGTASPDSLGTASADSLGTAAADGAGNGQDATSTETDTTSS